jgi:dihydroneopterin aldolase
VSGDRLTVSLRGLEAFGHHGVLPAEQALGQRFVVDLDVELHDGLASRTDDLIDTIDYASLADAVAALVSGPPVALLERLAGMIADLVLEEPWAAAVQVTVRKPHVALPQTVAATSVTLRRPAPAEPDPLVVLRRVAAALDARDEGALLGLVADRVEVADEAGTVIGRGPEGALAWLREHGRAGARLQRDGAELVTGDRAVAPVLVRLGDGTERRAALLVDARDGRAARLALLADRAAAGL